MENSTLLTRKERRAAEAQRRAAQLTYNEDKAVRAYHRTNGTFVPKHYKGFGPKKVLPNVPKNRLDVFLLEHGVTTDNLRKAYELFAFTDEKTTTHDLQAAGLLDTQAYFDALNVKAEKRAEDKLAKAPAEARKAAYAKALEKGA